MKKNLFLLCLISVWVHAIGVRQLQEFNSAKKEVEQLLAMSRKSGGQLSDDARQKLEKNILLIESIDKAVAQSYRAQIPQKQEPVALQKMATSSEELPVIEPGKSTQEPIVPVTFTEIQPHIVTINEEGQPQELNEDQPEDLSVEEEEKRLTPPSSPRTVSQHIAQDPKVPVFSVTAPSPVPVVTSKPEDRQPPVSSTQSAWAVPIPKGQKKAELDKQKNTITQKLASLETALDQVQTNLKQLNVGLDQPFHDNQRKFKEWNKSINAYGVPLDQLRGIDDSLYQEKIEKVAAIEKLFATRLYEQTVLSVKLMRGTIDPIIAILTENQNKKKSLLNPFSNDSEFQKVSYEFFFGKIDKKEWRNQTTRKNLGWFKNNHVKLFELYWEQGIKGYSELLFQYHNKKSGSMTQDQSDLLKAKMQVLREEVQRYKHLIAQTYNAMLTALKSLPADDQENQRKLIEDSYENHIKLLDESEKAIQNQFLNQLWPESATGAIT